MVNGFDWEKHKSEFGWNGRIARIADYLYRPKTCQCYRLVMVGGFDSDLDFSFY